MTDFVGRRQGARNGGRTDGVRFFVDAEGVRWQVREQPFSEYDRRRGVSLIFTSDGAVRRVRDYPVDWFSLSEDELNALSWCT